MAWPAWSPILNLLDFFLCGYAKLRAYHDGKPKHQLIQALDEAAVHVRNEMVHMQWYSDWQHVCSLTIYLSYMFANQLET